jgi:hypothetical protein
VNRTRITVNSFIFDVGIVQFYEEGQVSRETEILVKVKSETMLKCWMAIRRAFVPFNNIHNSYFQ